MVQEANHHSYLNGHQRGGAESAARETLARMFSSRVALGAIDAELAQHSRALLADSRRILAIADEAISIRVDQRIQPSGLAAKHVG